MNWRQVSGRTLAYLGDAVWSLVVREALIKDDAGIGALLQKKTVAYVNAKSQAAYYNALHEMNYFTEEEEDAFKRGRNDHSGTVPRNTPVTIYRKSTGFEAIIGMLELCENRSRISEIWEKVKDLKETNA